MRWTTPEVRVFWDDVKRIALHYARKEGFRGENAVDCAQDFVSRKLWQHVNPLEEAWSEDGMAKIRKQARLFAKRRFFKFSHTIGKDVCWADLENEETKLTKFQRALVCPVPGPEETVIQAEFFDRLLQAIDGLEPQQQAVWTRHFLDGMHLVDLEDELGRSKISLWQAVFQIRKRLPKLLAGCGITADDIAEYRYLFAAYRSKRLEGRSDSDIRWN